MLPKIIIITPSYQQGEFLEECLRSVQEQDYPAVEHIVVDGGSTDGSLAVIQQHASHLAWWCSEADSGQSHALNKGLAHASGEVFGWINSDDLLLPGALHKVGEAFAADPQLRIYGGRRILLHPDGTRITSPLDDATDVGTLFTAPAVNQQSTFYRMDAARAVGGVDEALQFVMDLDLWWRMLMNGASDHILLEPEDLAVFRLHAGTKTSERADAFVVETAAVLRAMAVATEQHELAELLDLHYPSRQDLRPSNAKAHHRDQVRRMIFLFLLKWNGIIGDRSRFELVKRMCELFPATEPISDQRLFQRWAHLRRNVVGKGWNTYRIIRKLSGPFQ